jgi:hypothetical protein
VQTANDDGKLLEDESRDFAIEDNIFYATAQHNAHTVQTANDDGKLLEDKSKDYAIEDNIFYATAQHNAHTLCKQPTMMGSY